MSTLGDTLEGLVAKLREQAHEAESPYGTKTPEEPDWDYVAKAFREIADELAAALAAEGPRQRVVDAIVKGNVETLLAMQAAAPSLHKEGAGGALAVKVQSWANNSAVYEAEHAGSMIASEYHRGAKEAFQRVADALAATDAPKETPRGA